MLHLIKSEKTPPQTHKETNKQKHQPPAHLPFKHRPRHHVRSLQIFSCSVTFYSCWIPSEYLQPANFVQLCVNSTRSVSAAVCSCFVLDAENGSNKYLIGDGLTGEKIVVFFNCKSHIIVVSFMFVCEAIIADYFYLVTVK